MRSYVHRFVSLENIIGGILPRLATPKGRPSLNQYILNYCAI